MPFPLNIYNPFPYEGLLCAYHIQLGELEKALSHCSVYLSKTKNSLLLEDLATLAYESKNLKLLQQLKEFAEGLNTTARDYVLALYYHLSGKGDYKIYLKRYLEETQPPREVLTALLSPVLESKDVTLYWIYMYRLYEFQPSDEKLLLLKRFLLSLDTSQLEKLRKEIDKFLNGEGDRFLYTSAVLVYTNLLRETEKPDYLPKAVEVVFKALKCCPNDETFQLVGYTTLSAARYFGVKLPEGDFFPYRLLEELSNPYPPLGKIDEYLREVDKLSENVRRFVYADLLLKEVRLGNIRIAERILKRALQKGFSISPPLGVKLVVYLAEKFLGQPSRLDYEIFKEFAETYPDAPETYLLKAIIDAKTGDLEAAKNHLKKVKEEDLPSVVRELKDYHTALRVYLFGEDIKKFPPPKAGVVLRIVYELDPEKAKVLAEEYLKACPDTDVFKQILAKFSPKCLEMPEFISEIGIKCHPDDPWLLNFLGYTYLLEGKNLNEAIRLLEKAHKLNPESPDILDSLGWGYFLKGDLQKAEEYIEKALQKEPNEPVILYHYGEILLKENKPCEAKKVFKKSLERLLKLPAEPERGIIERVKKSLKEAEGKCHR